jgi:integrase
MFRGMTWVFGAEMQCPSPTSGATFPKENDGFDLPRTDRAQNSPDSGAKVKFPVHVKHRKQEAVIYGRTAGYDFYRVAAKVAGKRVLKSFATYSEAREYAEQTVRDLARGNPSAALSADEAGDALAIRQALDTFKQETGGNPSALEAVSGYLAAVKLLPKGSTVLEACRAYARTIGSVKPKTIADAIADFLASRQGKVPKPGERARLSPVYARNVASWLNGFRDTFPGHLVSDLCPEFLEQYFGAFGELSAKARNDRRGAVGMWLRWSGRKDFIEAHQLAKLLDCDAMKAEILPDATIALYTPGELQKLLDASDGALLAVTALEAFGGARLQEALRLRWEDLHRTPGHVEISGAHAKTRKRRLLEVGPALAAWLAPFKDRTGAIWAGPLNSFITEWARLRESVGVPSKRNGVRHAFVSYSYALRGEIVTAALAGTSPQILHANYRGLARREEAEAWFAVGPAPAAANIIPLQQAAA